MAGKIEYFDEIPENKEQKYRERKLRDYNSIGREKRSSVDLPLVVLTLVILTIGVVMVLSASYARAYYTIGNPTKYFVRQAGFAIAGVGVMFIASRFRTGMYRRFAFVILGISIFTLLLVLIPGIGTGKEETGAQRWINLGFTTFQPSEIAKIGVILSFAAMACMYKEKMKTLRYGVFPFGIILAVIVGLLILEPHLSGSIIIIGVGGVMMFVGGTKTKWLVILALIAFVIGYILIGMLGYASDRIETWKDPFADESDNGYQTVQSLYAIGSGGLFGLGFGQGRQKYLYLPEEHNDFIFSIVCEELGFVGAVFILFLFAMLIIRGYWIALHARDRFGSLIATGITTLFAIQIFLNVAVVTNLFPCTGVSLPFFSYGGTALLIQMFEIGIILSVSREIPMKKIKESSAE